MIKKSSTIVVMAGILSMAGAHADPLQGIFSSLSNIGKQLQGGSSQPAGQQPDPAATADSSPAGDIMQTLASSSVGLSYSANCEPALFKENEQSAMARIKSGDFAGGGTDAKLNAEEIAICAVKRHKLPMDVAEQIAGQNLAESAIALHHAGMDTTETLTSAKNALTLLNLDASKNADLISALNSSGVLPKAPPAAANQAAMTMTASAAASQLMANSFAFNQKYNAKTLKITGKVRSISGGQNVFVVLEGVPQDDPGINDQVDCTISNPAYTNAAMSISKGQKIAVQGIYTVPAQSWLQHGVDLQDCHIVQ